MVPRSKRPRDQIRVSPLSDPADVFADIEDHHEHFQRDPRNREVDEIGDGHADDRANDASRGVLREEADEDRKGDQGVEHGDQHVEHADHSQSDKAREGKIEQRPNEVFPFQRGGIWLSRGWPKARRWRLCRRGPVPRHGFRWIPLSVTRLPPSGTAGNIAHLSLLVTLFFTRRARVGC